MKTQWTAIALVILTSTATAESTDQQAIKKAVEAKPVMEKLEACLQREPLEREFLKFCMNVATTFADVEHQRANIKTH